MAKKKIYKKKLKPELVNEPIAAYGAKRVQFFKSFEDQENDHYMWLSSLTPEEHLYYATQLIKRVFASELKQIPTLGNRIKFD